MENSGHSPQTFCSALGPRLTPRAHGASPSTWSQCPVGLTLASTPCFWHLSLGDWEIWKVKGWKFDEILGSPFYINPGAS